jgi:hypothetical protein
MRLRLRGMLVRVITFRASAGTQESSFEGSSKHEYTGYRGRFSSGNASAGYR